MLRRTFVRGGLASCLVTGALYVRAQPASKLPLVVLINAGTEERSRRQTEVLVQGLQQLGRVDGRTFRLSVRHADGDTGRYAKLIRECIAESPAVLVVTGLIAARAARDATDAIPIVVATASDLVDAGIVGSHARPGGNITGVSDLTDEAAAKRLELVKAALPGATRVAVLVNPDFPATPKIETRVSATAKSLGMTIVRVQARDRESLLAAVDSLGQSKPHALLVGGDSVATTYRLETIDHASALGIPVFHYWPGTAEHGALLSLQVDIEDNFRRAAGYIDKILKGAKPGDLPLYHPTRYELVVNLKTAKALGLAIPQSLLLRADRVIQ